MAARRQGLSQRRKAVGLTQESLAQRLGVERSTIVRWEAGDTEPLPSTRPQVARALQISIEELAALLAESAIGGPTRARSVDTEVTIPALKLAVRSETGPGAAEAGAGELVPPRVAETFEALRRALRSAGVVPADWETTAQVGRSLQVPPAATQTLITPVQSSGAGGDPPTDTASLPNIDPAGVGPGTPDPTTIEPRPRRLTRFAAAGVLSLVLAAGATSAPFIASYRSPLPPPVTKTPAPATAFPAPVPGGNNDSSLSKDPSGAARMAPAAPNPPAEVRGAPGSAAVAAPPTVRSGHRVSGWSTSHASTTKPALTQRPTIPAQAYAAWSRMAALSRNYQARSHFQLITPTRP